MDTDGEQLMKEIPAPRGLPLVGNALQIPSHSPIAYFEQVAEAHPEGIFQPALPGRKIVGAHDPDVGAEACDEPRFRKEITPPLSIVRAFAGDGLFTASPDEPVWGHAHRILM